MAEISQERAFQEYISQRKWNTPAKTERIRYLHRIAQNSKRDRDISGKIGGMLIYNQIIEQFLSAIIEMSIYYVKAEIWPVTVSFDVELDKATFGKVIDYFTQYLDGETQIVHISLSSEMSASHQNARLAARLTGFKIDIKSETQAKEIEGFLDYDVYEEEEYDETYDEYDYDEVPVEE